MIASTRFLSLLLVFLLISGCSLLPKEKDETKGWSAQKFYSEASFAMSDADYEKAIKYYEGLEARYPFGRYAMQAQLDVAYAYYKNGQYDSAIAAADRFIKLHPRNPFVDYAYYLKGIVNFNRNIDFLSRFIPTDTSQRDPSTTLDSFNDFEELIRRYPESPYAEDARTRLIYLRNNLAMHEVHVARYYMKRGAYLAAANRAVRVIEDYQRAPAVKDALELMIDAYGKLGMDQLQTDAKRVYDLNLAQGNFDLPGPAEPEEKSIGRVIWDSLELDKN